MADDREQTSLESQSQASLDTATDEEEEEDVGSPFDHPAFLPVLLLALATWFGFDGWFSETIESVRFNRYGFFFLVGAALYFSASELVRIPYLLSMLWGAYAIWLAAFWLMGADDAWWRDDSGAMLFNQYGAAACALIAVGCAIWEARQSRRGPVSAAE